MSPMERVRLRWMTLVADQHGNFVKEQVYMFVAAFLALVGGLVLVVCSVLDGFTHLDFDNGTLALMAGVCVAPLTGGTVTTAIKNHRAKRETSEVLAGRRPDRRSGPTESVRDTEPNARVDDERGD